MNIKRSISISIYRLFLAMCLGCPTRGEKHMAEKIVCDYFIVSQSETIKSAVIGGCRASGEPMGFKSEK